MNKQFLLSLLFLVITGQSLAQSTAPSSPASLQEGKWEHFVGNATADEPGWRIEIKRYQLLTTVGAKGNWHDPNAKAAFYTQDDIREIVAYAAERDIMMIPEIDMPGHATAACRAYPNLSGGGQGKWKGFTFHPCREETFQFINDVLDEIVSLFPAPYIHIGGDEVHYGNQDWFTDPGIQAFIQQHRLGDEAGLEHYFVRRVADMIAAKGKTMVGWDEIVDAGVSPQKAVVMWWRHDRKYQLLKALERGYRVVISPKATNNSYWACSALCGPNGLPTRSGWTT